MAEAAGLVLGAVGLAALFSTCVECFDYVHTAKCYEKDRNILHARLQIEKVRLWWWGQVLGLHKREDAPKSLLNVPAIRAAVENNLEVICQIFDDEKELIARYGLRQAESENENRGTVAVRDDIGPAARLRASFGVKSSSYSQEISLKLRARWAIHDKTKFVLLVQDLKALIDGLHDVTPASKPTSRLLVKREIESIQDCEALELLQEASEIEYQDLSEVASVAFERYTARDFGGESLVDWAIVPKTRPPSIVTFKMNQVMPDSLPHKGSSEEKTPKGSRWKAALNFRTVAQKLKLVKPPRTPLAMITIPVNPKVSRDEKRSAALQRALCRAAFSGNEEDTRQFITQGASASLTDSNGLGMLHYLIKGEHMDLLEAFATAETVASTESKGKSLMHSVLSIERTEKTRHDTEDWLDVLLKYGADMEEPDESGASPLIAGAMKNEEYFVCKLIEAGAIIDAQDASGRTALSYAVLHKSESRNCICALLLRHGADTELKDANGWTAIQHLVSQTRDQCEENLDILMNGNPNINVLTEEGLSLLDTALANEFFYAAQLLIEKGLRVAPKYTDSYCASVKAAELGDHTYLVYLSVLALLPGAAECDHQHTTSCGEASLWAAVYHSRPKCVEVLLLLGTCATSCREEDGWNLLHAAIDKGDKHVLKALIESEYVYNTILDSEDTAGRTPLLMTLQDPLKSELAMILLDTLFIVLHADGEHKLSPISAAMEVNNNEVVMTFLRKYNYYSDISEILGTLMELSNEKALLLAEYSEAICFRAVAHGLYGTGETVLHRLAEVGKQGLLQFFLDLNRAGDCELDLMQKNNHGRTARDVALLSGHHKIARLLAEEMPSDCRELVLWVPKGDTIVPVSTEGI